MEMQLIRKQLMGLGSEAMMFTFTAMAAFILPSQLITIMATLIASLPMQP